MKETFKVLDSELNTNWEQLKDKLYEVQANLTVQINSEAVKRVDGFKDVNNSFDEIKAYINSGLTEMRNSSIADIENYKRENSNNSKKLKTIEEGLKS